MSVAKFETILLASGEDLLKRLYQAAQTDRSTDRGRKRRLARALGLSFGQLLCGVGFNRHIRELPDIVALLGYSSYDALAQRRNTMFATDIYDELRMRDVLSIYSSAKDNLPLLEIIQHLMRRRLEHIEQHIETTVSSSIIERYKREVRAIYGDGIASVDFAEQRLDRPANGFRALLNEVVLIAEHRIIPIGDLFFRDTLFPEEKRRLIGKGLVPPRLIHLRLADADVAPAERDVLLEHSTIAETA
ncbi:MAG: hypothetical protein IT494_08795 [Gammaproteobacteria bacterium]|nr:hypothetical protein [Gammaproteobacteria bacterium]